MVSNYLCRCIFFLFFFSFFLQLYEYEYTLWREDIGGKGWSEWNGLALQRHFPPSIIRPSSQRLSSSSSSSTFSFPRALRAPFASSAHHHRSGIAACFPPQRRTGKRCKRNRFQDACVVGSEVFRFSILDFRFSIFDSIQTSTVRSKRRQGQQAKANR